MTSKPRKRRGPRFCPLSERDVVNSEYGTFPRKESAQREGSFPSTVPDQPGDLSLQPTGSNEELLLLRRSPSGDPIGDTVNGNEISGDLVRSNDGKKKSKIFSQFLFTRSKLFHRNRNIAVVSEPNQTDDTVVDEDVVNSPDRQYHLKEVNNVKDGGNAASDAGPVANAGASEDRQIANDNKRTQETTSQNEIRPFPISLDADTTASSKKKVSPPPLTEIMKYQRRNSGSSDVSSLSGAGAKGKDILEYFLAMDMRERQSNKMFTEDILNIARQKDTLQLQQSHSTESSTWEPLPSCLILLTDPMQRIFEMVSVPYVPKKDTVRRILKRCTKNAKDDRLKKQKYVGLAYEGDHCSLEKVPRDIIRKSVAEGKPLMGIPAKYSAHQIQIVGKSLLANPSIQVLLKHQLKSIGLTPKGDSRTEDPEIPVSQIVVPPRRNISEVDSA